jgi:hypothetical protein
LRFLETGHFTVTCYKTGKQKGRWFWRWVGKFSFGKVTWNLDIRILGKLI